MTTTQTKAEIRRENAIKTNELVKAGDKKEIAKLKRQLIKLGL